MAITLTGGKNIFYYSSGGPRPTLTSSNVGLVRLKDTDVFNSGSDGYMFENIVANIASSSASLTTIVAAHTTSSNSSYAFAIASIIVQRSMIESLPITGSKTGYLFYFRNTLSTDYDIAADTRIQMGQVSAISIRKLSFGEQIRPYSFTATTTAGYIFTETASGDGSFGIISVCGGSNSVGLSAGIIFYDTGIAIFHGPTLAAIASLSALTNVSFYSTYKIYQLNVFCTAGGNELNYTTNENAFYQSSITSDPNENITLTAYSSCAYNWGINSSLTSGRGNFYLYNLFNKDPYITAVGLYNDDNELLAIAKIAQPIRKTSTVPMTFRISLDLQ